MATLDSNLDEVARLLDQLIAGFNFTRTGKEQSLGRDLAAKTAEGIHDRSVPGRLAPDGSQWDDNEPKYAAKKRAKYDADQPNVRTGQMLSLASLKGKTEVGPDLVVMTYGLDAPPGSALNGTELTTADKAVTDSDKAGWCAALRPFYGLDATISAALHDVARAALDEYLQ